MRVFISHQRADSETALRISRRLRDRHAIDSYLDVIDPFASQTGDALGEYIRRQLGLCTQLMAVVSPETKGSWWVPWEIGISTEKDYPIATFAGSACDLPSYLRKWPYLESGEDLDLYASQSKQTAQALNYRVVTLSEAASAARRATTPDFHAKLRRALKQG